MKQLRRSARYQRGAAFIVMTAVLLAVGLGFVLLQAVELARQRANSWQSLQLARVNEAAQLVHEYYLENAATIDAVSQSGAPDDATILSLARVPAQWNLSAYVSDPITNGAIKYREIAILAPSDNGPPLEIFDHGAGTLVLCPGATAKCPPRANSRIDGYVIESELYGRSLKILNDLALAAQAYFNAKYLSFPDHNTALNWFRAPYSLAGECTPGTTDMPCLDGWTDVLDSSLHGAQALALLWQPDQDPAAVVDCIMRTIVVNGVLTHACPFTNAWGGTIYLANGNNTLGEPLGLNSTSIPYRLALKTETPWNIPIEIFAVQTL